jgi:hypothetical protein
MTDDELLGRLDKIQATLQLAFRPQLEHVRNAVRSDDVNASILDLSDDWIGSSALQQAVAKKTGKSTRTVRDRLPELAEQRILDVRGSEKRLEYRRTGLV